MHEPNQRNPWVCLKCGQTNSEWVIDCRHCAEAHKSEQSSGNPGELDAPAYGHGRRVPPVPWVHQTGCSCAQCKRIRQLLAPTNQDTK